MTIKEYYQSSFQLDISRFILDPRVPYFGHNWHIDCRGLEHVAAADRPQFLVCLYFTVLVDQAIYAHYQTHYEKFESLTRYPKFCHGLGQFQKNPRDILLSPIETGKIKKEEIDRLLPGAMQLFVGEVANFLKQHLPEIKPDEFFDKLLYDPDVQIPLIIVFANPEMKNDTGVLAYTEMKMAIQDRTKRKLTP